MCGERAMNIIDIGWGFSLQLASCQKDSCIKLATGAIEYAQGIVTIPSELIILRCSDGRQKGQPPMAFFANKDISKYVASCASTRQNYFFD